MKTSLFQRRWALATSLLVFCLATTLVCDRADAQTATPTYTPTPIPNPTIPRNPGPVAAWGDNSQGQCTVPSPNENFAVVATGVLHSLGRKSNGTIVGWGYNSSGQCTVPSPNTNFVAVGGGTNHSLGL